MHCCRIGTGLDSSVGVLVRKGTGIAVDVAEAAGGAVAVLEGKTINVGVAVSRTGVAVAALQAVRTRTVPVRIIFAHKYLCLDFITTLQGTTVERTGSSTADRL
jgi:hypothetical protein